MKAGHAQYMKTVKASIVGSECVTEEGYCWLSVSVSASNAVVTANGTIHALAVPRTCTIAS